MIINRLAADVFSDEYFKTLYTRLLRNITFKVFQEPLNDKFNKKELLDILKFADILSSADKSEYRQVSFQIIALLCDEYQENEVFKLYANSVLSKLGNFPGLELLSKSTDNLPKLPYEREQEKFLKQYIHRVPGENAVFTDAQYKVYSKLINKGSFSFSGPTSMGKSYIFMSLIYKIINEQLKKNVVIIVPTRALINQYSIEINTEKKKLLEENNYKVFTNSNVKYLLQEKLNYIFILTPERLLSLLSQKLIPKIDFLLVDEAHKLSVEGNDIRSITMYTAIEKALLRFKDIRVYFASPNTANPNIYLELFNKNNTDYENTIEAPVTQNLYYVDLVENYVKRISEYDESPFTPSILFDAENEFDLIKKIGAKYSNIIYCNSTNNTITKAKEFSDSLQNEQIEYSKEFKQTIKFIETYIHKDYFLIDCLYKRVGFHFSTLPQVIRKKIEELFKKGEIKYIFCTPTLLEGINLPAKNIFILSNKKGNANLTKMDFWNLAGRAGRLKYDLSGNIFCIRKNNKEWKNKSVLSDKQLIKVEPSILDKTEKNLDDIENVLNNKEIKPDSIIEKEIIEYIANIISIETLELSDSDYASPIINRLLKEGKNSIVTAAQESVKKNIVPKEILSANQSINIDAQNSVYLYLQKRKDDPSSIILPYDINYENCSKILHRLHILYAWNKNDADLNNFNSLRYYAFLMNQWMNGVSLNQMIRTSINYYHEEKKSISIYKSGKKINEDFIKSNKLHINMLINRLIKQIDDILRFSLEKYLSNYYLMLIQLLGEDNAGANWSAFLEYGTSNPIIIALQNLGFSRHVASLLVRDNLYAFKIENYKIINIDKELLKNTLDKDSAEYEEVMEMV